MSKILADPGPADRKKRRLPLTQGQGVTARSVGVLGGVAVLFLMVLMLTPRMIQDRGPDWLSLVTGTLLAAPFGTIMMQVTRRLLERDRAAQEAMSSERAGFQMREQSLAALAEVERYLLADSDGEGYRAALETLGKLTQARRCTLYSLRRDPRDESLLATPRQSWTGASATIPAPLQEFSLTHAFPRWLEALCAGEIIEGNVATFPAQERPQLEARGIRSIIVLPFGESSGVPRGLLVLENARTPDNEFLRSSAMAFLHAEARRDIERATRRQALHDTLTDLPNRLHLREELERRLSLAVHQGSGLAVVFLDLDRFKQINDTLGHDFGDRFLQYVVKHRLLPCLGADDFLARVGGDEFVLVLSAMEGEVSSTATQRASAILRSLTLPITLEGQELYVSTSIGISRFPEDGESAEMLMKHADVAMYAVKESGKNNFRFFETAMEEGTSDKLKLEGDLRHALDPRFLRHDTFVMYYQPQVDARTGHMLGLEALIRWNHPRRGLILPGEFVPVAEETGLILALGEQALRSACAQAAAWVRAGVSLRVAVNLSARQLHERELLHQVERILTETQLPAASLDLEFTETAMMKDFQGALSILTGLKRLGVRLSVDDFGAGISAISQLKDFPFDCVKIENLFIRGLTESEKERELVRALIGLARAMGADVLAEGVETPRQCELLVAMGCTQMQGHLFSPALTADDLEARFFPQIRKAA